MEGWLTGGVALASVFEDLDVRRDLFSGADLGRALVDIVRNQFVAPTGLAINQDFASSKFWDHLEC